MAESTRTMRKALRWSACVAVMCAVAAAASVASAATFSGTLAVGDFASHAVTLSAHQVLEVSMVASTGTDFDLVAYKSGEATVVARATTFAYPEKMYVAADTAGDYVIEVAAGSGSGGYVVQTALVTRTPPVIARINGSDRYGVAAAAAKTAWPGWAGITDVVVACGEDRAAADPLCAAGMAGAYNAPVLLVKSVLASGKLPGATESAIAGIRAANGGKTRIHVVGGTVSVPPAVYNRLAALKGAGGSIERINAADRYSLSVAMATRASSVVKAKGGSVPFVMIANGENPAAFYDALAASPVSFAKVAPTMMSKTSSLPSPVKSALTTTFKGKTVVLVSAPGFLTSAVKTQSGALYNIADSTNRYDAANDIAEFAFSNRLLGVRKIAITNKLPDALTGGVAMGKMGGPVLYTAQAAFGDATTRDVLYESKGATDRVYVVGGPASVAQSVMDAATAATRF